MSNMEQLLERLNGNIGAFTDIVAQATTYKAQSDSLRKQTDPMARLKANLDNLDEEGASALMEQISAIDPDLLIAVNEYNRITTDLLVKLGASSPDRSQGDQMAQTLTEAANTFKSLGMGDLDQIATIEALVTKWTESRPASAPTARGTRREKGEGMELTAHCTHTGCTWNNVDRTNANSLRWGATGHWKTHHPGQERPAKDGASAKGREVWLSMTDALNLLKAGGNGQTSADALKAEFRFDKGDTTTK